MFFYRRNLPHLQQDTRALFITFRTHSEFNLTDELKDIVLKHCKYDHLKRYELFAAVVMSTHVHLLLAPFLKVPLEAYSLREIMSGIKGSSAHSINKRLKRKGHVWQDESFDHLIRANADFEGHWMYIVGNPVAAGLVRDPYEYKWLFTWSRDQVAD